MTFKRSVWQQIRKMGSAAPKKQRIYPKDCMASRPFPGSIQSPRGVIRIIPHQKRRLPSMVRLRRRGNRSRFRRGLVSTAQATISSSIKLTSVFVQSLAIIQPHLLRDSPSWPAAKSFCPPGSFAASGCQAPRCPSPPGPHIADSPDNSCCTGQTPGGSAFEGPAAWSRLL